MLRRLLKSKIWTISSSIQALEDKLTLSQSTIEQASTLARRQPPRLIFGAKVLSNSQSLQKKEDPQLTQDFLSSKIHRD